MYSFNVGQESFTAHSHTCFVCIFCVGYSLNNNITEDVPFQTETFPMLKKKFFIKYLGNCVARICRFIYLYFFLVKQFPRNFFVCLFFFCILGPSSLHILNLCSLKIKGLIAYFKGKSADFFTWPLCQSLPNCVHICWLSACWRAYFWG